MDNRFAPPRPSPEGSPWARWTRWALIGLAVALILPVPAIIGWQAWRMRSAHAFCLALREGMSLDQLFALERQHSVDESYIVQAIWDKNFDQARTQFMEFRYIMLDPDFACTLTHDGQGVTAVTLLGFENQP